MKKEVNGYYHIKYTGQQYPEREMISRSKEFYEYMDKRRSVREIDQKSVPKEIIENVIKTAATAPSGAHKQPWTFCAIADPVLKKKIREAAEKEEYESYNGRMSERWLNDLKPMATNWEKPFLEESPWLIVVCKRVYEMDENEKANNYYVNESVGIACGMLITAIHNAGLATLTHTPSPMNFLTKLLGRPENERAFLLLPVGYPKADALVPELSRKNLEEMAVFY
ncbi:MAG: nitroreductase family protein [Cyclobacteriaceae bacterium]